MQSEVSHPKVVEHYLLAEIAAGNVVGPFPLDPLKGSVMINRFGLIPKGNKPENWRLVVDLFYPHGSSVNDGISSGDASMAYAP